MTLLTHLAVWTRQIAAALALTCAVQFGFRSFGTAMHELSLDRSLTARDSQVPDTSELRPDRPDLEKLEELIEKEKSIKARGFGTEEEQPVPRRRRLLVDFGPVRSKVYVNGVLVGRTPYVGQVSCLDGDLLKIQILPEVGAPQTRKVICEKYQVVADRNTALSESIETKLKR